MNTTWSMSVLAMAAIGLSGTIDPAWSQKLLASLAAPTRFWASAARCETSLVLVASSTNEPGLTVPEIPSPITIDATVVSTKSRIVRPPIRPSFRGSPRLATPTIRAQSVMGTAMNFSELMKSLPASQLILTAALAAVAARPAPALASDALPARYAAASFTPIEAQV